jgi:hypothetical protein
MLYCPPEHQQAVTHVLAKEGLHPWPVALEQEGVQIMQAGPWSQAQVPYPVFPDRMEII